MDGDKLINYYEILGVPYDADVAAIKKRYRELVRKFHPDVAVDKLAAHEKFVQIVDAYQTLVDPIKRSAYDAKLSRELGIPIGEAQAEAKVDFEAAPFSWLEERRRRTPLSLLIEAEQHMLRGDIKRALELCREVISAEPKNPQAYELLAEIFERMGNIEKAIEYFSYAAQLAPSNPYYRMQVERLLGGHTKHPASTTKAKVVLEPSPIVKALMLNLSVVVVALCLYAFHTFPKEPLSEFLPLPLPFTWLAPLCGLLCGWLLRHGGWLKSADRVLFYGGEPALFTKGGPPVGVLIALSALLNFYLSIIVAALLSWWNDDWEASLFVALGLSFLITLLFALLSESVNVIMLWGGSFVLLPFIIGWMLSSLTKLQWWE
ncbi:MAG: J domain-containing protein [Armatimonadota bacterium]|nr:J domain-containing protein [Armatimonadota bacterium]MCX7778043.1 J domain-containing protein [Armatimonadota bacterium]MDW8026073.1 J domain-containing protein [Armatimonadota bacterium]